MAQKTFLQRNKDSYDGEGTTLSMINPGARLIPTIGPSNQKATMLFDLRTTAWERYE